jgi:hypothetical protein
MKRTIEKLGRRHVWQSAVLAGLVACSPMIAFGDGKKSPDESRQEKTTRSQEPKSNAKFGSGGGDRTASRTVDKSNKSIDVSRTPNSDKATKPNGNNGSSLQTKSASKGGRTTVDSSVKTMNPRDRKGLNPEPEPPAKRIDLARDLKHESDKRLTPAIDAKAKAKRPNAGDLNGRNPQFELPRVSDGKGLAKGIGKAAGKNVKTDPSVKLNSGKFDKLAKGDIGKKLHLDKQFDLIKSGKGDLALSLGLHKKRGHHGGSADHHLSGWLSVNFGVGCAPITYCGPGYFPSHCLYPGWSDWVSWSWGFHCDPWFDPRPWFCRPWAYDPCPVWVCWDYPVWVSLPVATCGTWIDVEPLVIDAGFDLQLLAVRFVDPGHPDEQLGPRFRVWVRNNSPATIAAPFNVMLMAANSRDAVAGLPQAGVRVMRMEPGETQALDIRLPFDAARMGVDAEGRPAPFSQLHVLVDSHRELPEAFEANNGAVIARGDVLPVDPTIFSADASVAPAGAEINLAGEGFGPEPGQVIVQVGTLEMQAEITGWYDLGVRIKLPSLALAAPTEAEILIVRRDTAVSNPLAVEITAPVALR